MTTKYITVDVSPTGGGTVEIDGDAPPEYPYDFPVEAGATIKIEAIPEDGYRFVNWSGENLVVNDNPDFEPVIRDMAITAHFAPDSVEYTSADGMVSVAIPYGVTALDGDGNPLTEVEFAAIKRAPDPPEDYSVIGLPYQLKPEGTTFDRPVMLTWRYDTGDIPEGIAEEDLIITRCDNFGDGLPELDFEINTKNDTISAYIDHFSCFTMLALADLSPDNPVAPSLPVSPVAPVAFTSSSLSVSPPEVSPGAAVTISALLTNPPGEAEGSNTVTLKIDGVVAETREDSLAGGASQMVIFTTSQGQAGTYAIEVNGLTGSFTVKEGASPVVAAVPASPAGSDRWPTVVVIIAIAATISIPLAKRWWRRRSDLGSLGDYISMR